MAYSSEAAFEECKRKAESIFDKLDKYSSKCRKKQLADLQLDSEDEEMPRQTCLMPKKTLLTIQSE